MRSAGRVFWFFSITSESNLGRGQQGEFSVFFSITSESNLGIYI